MTRVLRRATEGPLPGHAGLSQHLPPLAARHGDDTVVVMRLFSPGPLLTGLLLTISPLFAQQEIALTIGSLSGPSRTTTAGVLLDFSTGVAFQANYARYIRSYRHADLYGEVHVLASPQRTVTSTLTSATADFAALYVTPGVRVKFYPKNKLSPWAAGGGGYSLYEQSAKTLAGAPNAASRHSSGGAIAFGGGLDFKWSEKISFRAEARDFYTASPKFNAPIFGKGQFNFVIGAGVVFHLGVK